MTEILGASERDAVTEILNVAIGQAAASLSQMVEDEVTLSVPVVEFLSPAAAAARLDEATGRPSMRTIGMTRAPAPVRNASRASSASCTVNGRSSTA